MSCYRIAAVAASKNHALSGSVALALEGISKIVCSGRYSPGEYLVEADLSRELGLGRVPIREATRILAGDGLIELVRGRGARVPIISRLRLAEILRVHDALLGLACADLVASKNYPASMKKLVAQAQALRSRADKRDQIGILRAMIRYRELVVDSCGNSYLKDMTPAHSHYRYELYFRDAVTVEQLVHAVALYEHATKALGERDAAGAYHFLRRKNYWFINDLRGLDPELGTSGWVNGDLPDVTGEHPGTGPI